jgi:endonuclease/exonuclease/phosphatase family metal-dependent hydrolase
MLITTYNIQYTRSRDDKFDLQRIVDTVKDSDVIALQEVENFWDRSGNISQSAEIARLLPDHYYVWGPTVDVLKVSDAQDKRPTEHKRRQFGNMILSRHPILSTRNHVYPKFTAPGPHTIQRGAIEALIALPSGPVRFYSTHLDHLASRYRMVQLQELVGVSERALRDGPSIGGREIVPSWREEPALPDMPREAILLGDFNFEPTSPEYEWIAGPINRFHGRLSDAAGFADAYVAAGNADDQGHTLYRDFEAKTGIRIDYCFVPTWMKDRVKKAWVDEAADGSDHQPLRIELDL